MRCYDDPVRIVACLALVLVLPAWADNVIENAEIGRVIAAFTSQSTPLSELYTPSISDVDRAYLSPGLMSEVTRPRLEIRSIRLVSDVTALVEAENAQFGSLIMKRNESMLLVLRKYGVQWRIACVLPPPTELFLRPDQIKN
jgi:hypothetical protein